MGLADTSPVPKKDGMGMDYIPVYEGEDDAGAGLKISTERVQKLLQIVGAWDEFKGNAPATPAPAAEAPADADADAEAVAVPETAEAAS